MSRGTPWGIFGTGRVGIVLLAALAIVGFVGAPTHKKKGKCPMKDGVLKRIDSCEYSFEESRPGSDIYGSDSVVMSATSGVVQAILTIEDWKAVMIRSGRLFYTYALLDTCIVVKGQNAIAGQILGFVNGRHIEFLVSNSKGEGFWRLEDYVDCRCQLLKRRQAGGY